MVAGRGAGRLTRSMRIECQADAVGNGLEQRQACSAGADRPLTVTQFLDYSAARLRSRSKRSKFFLYAS
jgi:hypothetical protein